MWLRIDERTDVLASLSLCSRCLDLVSSERTLWKWAILSMHNAMQGAMGCHLSGTAQLGALTDQCIDAWLDWHERDGRGEIKRISDGINELGIPKTRIARAQDFPPDERLADAKVLFKRLSSQNKRRESAGAVLNIDDAQRESFGRLHDLRKEFAHFTPKGWSIELSGLPKIFLDMVDVLEQISADQWPFRHMGARELATLRGLLKTLRTQLCRLSA